LAKPFNYLDFVYSTHPSYRKYLHDWLLCERSLYGGVEYRDGEYLKAYSNDFSTPSEVINTYTMDDEGNQTGVLQSYASRANSRQDANSGDGYTSNFYQEKLANVPVFPYTRLYTSEYNAILFRSPPQRNLPDTPEVDAFQKDADGQGNSLNEFMSAVDTFTTVFGVVWISCMKPMESSYAKWRMHKPTDVTNWQYGYNASGDLELKRILIRVASEPDMEIYHYYTPEEFHIIFRPLVDEAELEFEIPENAEAFITEESETFYRIFQENELGYIPVRPVYQSTPIKQGIGHTPIFDIAQIQRSVYSDMGEIYSAVSYGAHPVNIVDEETLNRNGNSVGAEPGAIIITGQSLDGQPNYVYEFVAPDMGSLTQIRDLMDQKIEKMNQVAMIRSDELIKASRSGVQIEMYDSKLEAFIRKKATALENAEFNLWQIWFDWMDMPMPDDLTISYNRLYSQKGLENEIKEMNTLLDAYERYNSVFVGDTEEFTAKSYSTEAEAEAEAQRLGGTGTHSHEQEDGTIIYMPFTTHDEYELKMEMMSGVDMQEAPKFKEELKNKLQERLSQLIDSTYSSNSL
tara:strand:+ start:1658 stop:3376 length:1719 start_codon:yes stop_codon:yes gene_type:complete